MGKQDLFLKQVIISFVTAIKRLEEIDLNEMQKNIINTFHLNDYSMESHIKGLIDIYGD